jgi:hypothetical protein
LESEIRLLWFGLVLAAKVVDCRAQTVTNPARTWQPDSFHWEQPGLDGTTYARLEGTTGTPGETYEYGLKVPEGFFGHYCFNARAELILLRGELNLSSRRLREGERRRLAPGIIYSIQADMPAIVVISTTAPWPTRSEPGAPTTAEKRC